MIFSVKIYKKLYSFFKIYYTLKVLVITFRLWRFRAWVDFWLTTTVHKEIRIKGFSLLLRGKSLPTKLYELNIILENLLCSNYLDPSLKIKDDDTIIDIGAHVGSFCIPAAMKYRNSKIYAFEPEPENYNLLVKNIKLNDVVNVEPRKLAVAASAGLGNLFVDPYNSTGHSLTRKTPKSLEVQTTTLEQILSVNRVVHCGLLKIDCEGAEYEILLNTSLFNLSKIENIAMEYHIPKFFDLDNASLLKNLIEHLRAGGFDVTLKEVNYQIGYLKASRQV